MVGAGPVRTANLCSTSATNVLCTNRKICPMGKLNSLAKAASDFYEVPLEELKSKRRDAVYTKPRHNCHWIASDAGYKKSVIARYWGIDRTSVHYGIKIVNKRIKDKHEREELKRFLFFLKTNLQ